MQEVYKLTKQFPIEERYELTKQMKRASMSIIANTAEGFSKRSAPDKANKYTIARSECSEIMAFLYGAIAVRYVSEKEASDALSLCEKTGKLLSGLIQKHSHPQLPTP